MKKMKASPSLLLLLLICLLPLSLTLSYQEDDLVFDDVGEETPTLSTEEQQQQQQQSTASSITKNKKWQRVERLLGMPNAVATVGHVFKLHIPKQAFAGSIDYYEARGNNGKGLPHWLRWDEPAYAFYGVPSRKDIGRHRVTVKAFGKRGDVAQDSFIIHVVPEKREYFNHKDGKKHCTEDQDLTMLTILIDAKYENLKPSAKVNALENLAGFLGLRTNLFSIQPELNKDGPGNPYNGGSSVVLSGPGNVARRREKHSTIVQWQVGCDGHFWPHQINTIKLIPEQARDGTLSEVMQLPVYQWRVRSDAIDYARNRRDIAGSGSDLLPVDEDDDEYDEEEEYDDDDNDDYNEGITESPEPKLPKPVVHGGLVDEPKQSKPVLHGGVVDEHPHRHHHGEDSIAGIGAGVNNEEDIIWRNADLNNAIFNQTPTTTTTTTTTTPSTYTEASVPARESSSPFGTTGSWNENATEKVPGEPLDPYDSINVPVYSSTQSTTTSTTTEPTTTSTEAPTTTTKATTVVLTTESTTTTTTTTTTPSTTTPELTTTSTTPSTTTTTTTTTPTTERIDYGVNVYNTYNKPPKIERRLKKLSVTQGKPLSYIIPEDTFSDPENGNTRNLRLRIYENGAPLKPSYWLQFNEETQEIYGLPLQSEYGPYPFEVIAMDNEGNTVSEKLEVSVQQHKQTRTVNHQFHLYLKIEKKSEFPTNVDWELKVLRSLGELYGDSDLSYITVLNVDEPIGDQAIYSWTNDSLVRTNSCPVEEINRLYRVLVSDVNTEEPSEALMDVLGPEIRPKRIVYEGFEQCQEIKETQRQKEYPFTRNQIDQVNATAGQLFVYKVPQDTFFDESDGDTRRLRVYLLTANRTEIPSSDWLQFDSNNQEFFGVPLKQDIGRRTYQLIARDSDGLEGIDSLIAEVRPSPIIRHVVEISMTLNMPYEVFANSAGKKREFIEKLQKLYGDRNVSAISLLSISGNRDTTTVTWRNLTLPTDECPHDEITRLRRVLVNDNKSFTDELNREFNSNSQQPEFSVIQITVSQMGACQGPVDFGPEMPPIDDSTSVGASHDDYLITFVLPAIIIAAMLILAGIIACILYKRRRSGKMSVSEKDDERQSFRSKGIPVIFQDELDEKPDPGNKSPIILKEEKPPLPPPEYQRAEDGADIPMLSKENSEEPYQPPPPFATNRDNNRQNRPKPTPTYRKPPPYVPP